MARSFDSGEYACAQDDHARGARSAHIDPRPSGLGYEGFALRSRATLAAAFESNLRASRVDCSSIIGRSQIEKYAVTPSFSANSAPSPTAPTSATHGTRSSRQIRATPTAV